MILDRIENVGLYAGLSERLDAGLSFLTRCEAQTFTDREERIDGDDVFAIFQSYATRTEAGRLFETHDRHIDIQYVLEGRETIRVAHRDKLRVHTAYDPDNDITWYDPGDAIDVVLPARWLAILYPHEAHLPQVATDVPETVKKIVVKVRVSETVDSPR